MLHQRERLLNQKLLDLEVYSSKNISKRAKLDPDIIGMSLGEPFFGPPDYLLETIAENELTTQSLLDSLKQYESARGSIHLREAVSHWYKINYDLDIDPVNEVMITHGGVEAIVLSILCVSEEKDCIAVTDPSYMLYKRSVQTLGRIPLSIYRNVGKFEYESIFDFSRKQNSLLAKAKALIINSPENPSGYVLSDVEWAIIQEYCEKTAMWIIHDEVYDTMVFDRKHMPFRTERSILVNSFSKKFGIPGLRIGWMIANKEMIKLASKIHDYLYLGVNILSEKIATHILADPRNASWLRSCSNMLKSRANQAMNILSSDFGYSWPRKPHGAMFLFPEVTDLFLQMPSEYKNENLSVGEAVANYLIEEKKVAVVPGSVYGENSGNYIRMVTCTAEESFNLALDYLSNLKCNNAIK